MKKFALIIIFCILSCYVYSRNDQFLIKFKLCELIYENDTFINISSPPIDIQLTKLSKVIPIYSSSIRTYGIQFEIFQSEIGNTPQNFIRIAFFYKEDKDWLLIDKSSFPVLINISIKTSTSTSSGECTSTSSYSNFYCNYSTKILRKD